MLSFTDFIARTRHFFSNAEKFALGGALALLALHALLPAAAQSALEYRPEHALGQPWRLLTAHLVHLNGPHVLVNALAWVLVARLFFRELDALRQIQTGLLAASAIGLVLLGLWPTIGHYRGFSGVLHALYFAGATTWWIQALRTTRARDEGGAQAQEAVHALRPLLLPTALLLGGTLKVILESPWGTATPWVPWLGANVVPQAHAIGALTGLLSGMIFVPAIKPNTAQRQDEQNE